MSMLDDFVFRMMLHRAITMKWRRTKGKKYLRYNQSGECPRYNPATECAEVKKHNRTRSIGLVLGSETAKKRWHQLNDQVLHGDRYDEIRAIRGHFLNTIYHNDRHNRNL